MSIKKFSDFLRFIYCLCLIAFVAVGLAKPVYAGASLTVSGEDWDIGTVGAEATATTGTGNKWTITNDSGGTEDFEIKVETTIGTWTARTTNDNDNTTDEFILREDSSLTSNLLITGTNKTLASEIANAGNYGLDLWFKAPPQGSQEESETLTITLTATNWLKPDGYACSAGSECTSGNCIDSYCCDTACGGNCDSCDVAGSLGTCMDVDATCTGNCDYCSSGTCSANEALCTGNCDQCDGSGTSYSCSANTSLCTGNCDVCTGSGTSYSCSGQDSLCSNTDASCYCSGSGTSFNCQPCSGTCKHCTSYSCNATTNWGAGLYGCASPNRCWLGACVSCGGYYYDTRCWYAGANAQNCNTVCSNRSGSTGCNVPSYTDCRISKHFVPGCNCDGQHSHGPMWDSDLSGCRYCSGEFTNCGTGWDGMIRACACNR